VSVRETAERRATPRALDARRARAAAAERAVAEHLTRAGWQIVACNLRVGALELDVVARRGALIAVVEVRTRAATSFTRGLGSIDAKKRLRIRRAGERLWQRRYRNDASVERMRFDAASVRWEGARTIVEYVPAAF
jgi:putative endonuclease